MNKLVNTIHAWNREEKGKFEMHHSAWVLSQPRSIVNVVRGGNGDEVRGEKELEGG